MKKLLSVFLVFMAMTLSLWAQGSKKDIEQLLSTPTIHNGIGALPWGTDIEAFKKILEDNQIEYQTRNYDISSKENITEITIADSDDERCYMAYNFSNIDGFMMFVVVTNDVGIYGYALGKFMEDHGVGSGEGEENKFVGYIYFGNINRVQCNFIMTKVDNAEESLFILSYVCQWTDHYREVKEMFGGLSKCEIGDCYLVVC